MAINESIFHYDEGQLYHHLKTRWEKYLNIYAHVPPQEIFNLSTLNINQEEKEFLFKSSIDYTICNKSDKPLMCIEFDGMCQGYSKNGKYIQIISNDTRRKKLDLKLRIAKEDNFPFYIVSYQEKNPISENIHLTILDGIIGRTIAKIKFQETAQELFDKNQVALDELNGHARHDYAEKLFISVEVGLDLEWNPIARLTANIKQELYKRDIVSSESIKFLSKPELPTYNDLNDIEGLNKRVVALDASLEIGAEVTLTTKKGLVTEQAWVRNFEDTHVYPGSIANDLAELLTSYSAAKLNNLDISHLEEVIK